MRLFEAIVDANHRALAGDDQAGLRPSEHADSLPIIALTCIDPRLNPIVPEVLGVPESHFIWLRNAGNIITGPLSSTMRSLALACAVKGGKEIVVLGHTDCLVCKSTTMKLTDAFRALGVDRARLPENLNEYFGLSASERQNVIRGADIVRQSPLIGTNVPVHGLLVDVQTGKLEWLVNGYQALGTAASTFTDALKRTAVGAVKQTVSDAMDLLAAKLPAFDAGEMKFPEGKIGDTVPSTTTSTLSSLEPTGTLRLEPHTGSKPALPLDPSAMFKIMGEDRKVYGPVPAREILQWFADGRIDGKTLAQRLGYKEWRPLATFLQGQVPAEIPLPPPIPSPSRSHKGKNR